MTFNLFIGTLEPLNNGPLHSNAVIGTLTIGECIWYSEERTKRAAVPLSPLLAVPNVTAHPSTASVSTSYYSMWRQSCTTLDPTRGSGRVGSGRVGSGQKIYRKGRVGSGRVQFGQRPKFNFKVP